MGITREDAAAMAAVMVVRKRWGPGTARELQRLRIEGVSVVPSDAQQMILEIVPSAMWEVTRVIEKIDPTYMGPNTVTIETRVTTIRLVDGDTSMAIDVLNTESVVAVMRQ